MPTLHLSEQVMSDLRARCEAAYPHEACGLLLGKEIPREGKGPKRMVLRAHPARNMNADQPQRRFELDPQDFIAADGFARAEGLEILGVYHSHPDHAAEPSPEDLASAQPAWFYVIVAVVQGRAGDIRCFALAGSALAEEKTCVC